MENQLSDLISSIDATINSYKKYISDYEKFKSGDLQSIRLELNKLNNQKRQKINNWLDDTGILRFTTPTPNNVINLYVNRDDEFEQAARRLQLEYKIITPDTQIPNYTDPDYNSIMNSYNWTNFSLNNPVALPNAGDTILLRSKLRNGGSAMREVTHGHTNTTFRFGSPIYSKGNLNYMYDKYGELTDPDKLVTLYDHLFRSSPLITPPTIPTRVFGEGPFYFTFDSCSELLFPPRLRIDKIGYAGLIYTFNQCKKMNIILSDQSNNDSFVFLDLTYQARENMDTRYNTNYQGDFYQTFGLVNQYSPKKGPGVLTGPELGRSYSFVI